MATTALMRLMRRVRTAERGFNPYVLLMSAPLFRNVNAKPMRFEIPWKNARHTKA
jgi:hypothetical protein